MNVSPITPRYNKSLRLSSSARAQFNQGEIMNLMEVDSQKFQDITSYLLVLSLTHSYLQTIWSGPFQIIVSLVMLFNEVRALRSTHL